MEHSLHARLNWVLSILICVGCTEYEDPSAENSAQPIDSEKNETSLFASRDEIKLHRERLISAEIARTLKELPGVRQARVHLSLLDNSILSDAPQEQSRAAILIVQEQGAPKLDFDIIGFVTAAVPNLLPENVHIVFSKKQTETEPLTAVGCFRVEASSATPLRITLGILLCVCILTAVGLIIAGIRLRRLRSVQSGRD
jgi:type III secretory pathway lipoprotein EscJ